MYAIRSYYVFVVLIYSRYNADRMRLEKNRREMTPGLLHPLHPPRSGPVAGPTYMGEKDGQGPGGRPASGISVKTKPKTKRPSLYKVLMLNDDYTPMEFVVYVLQRFFGMNHERAVDIMLRNNFV